MRKSFAELFKKYRLRAEFEKLSELGMALAEKGIIYEDSIFSHWQKGTRIPTNRVLVINLINIFVERKAIQSIDEANEFLESTKQGYLTQEEFKKLPQVFLHSAPFQVPREIAHFTGREEIINSVITCISSGGVFLIHGASGVGKTALAIHIGHAVKDQFSDGILWYKVDTANPMDILLSIAYMFHENISPIQDIEIRASIVRSILADKKILLILDNVEKDNNIRVLLPNSSSSVILTSKYKDISLDSLYEDISINSFSKKEVLTLFTKILSEEYVRKYQDTIIDIGNKVGNLPLALHLYAKQLAITKYSPETLLHLIEKSKTPLLELSYENKNLYISIDFSFQSLDKKTKKVFLSLGIFEGKDFSLEAVAAINKMKINDTIRILQKLVNASLLQDSTKQRYRLHPLIKQYIQNNTNISLYIKTTVEYYADFLEKNKRKNTKFYNTKNIYPEKENILFILEECYKQKLIQEMIDLWKNLGMFFVQTGEWEKVVYYGEKIYSAAKKTKDYYSYNYVICNVDILARIYYFLGNIKKSQEHIIEGLQIANYLQDEYLIHFSKLRLAKIYQSISKYNESLELLNNSLAILKRYNHMDELVYAYKFIGEVYLYETDYQKALDNFKKAFQIVSKTRDIVLLAIILSSLGTLYYTKKRYKDAKKYLTAAIKLEEKYGMRIGVRVFNNLTLALISKESEEIQRAQRYFQMAKQENQYLKIGSNAEKTYAIVMLLKEDLQQAGYYIFE